MRSDAALLLDMLLALRKIERFTLALNEQVFQANELVQSAVIREFQVLGEAARLVTEPTKQQHETVPWRLIAGMRNRLIHEYFSVRLDVVWATIQQDVPQLIGQLESLVPAEDEA